MGEIDSNIDDPDFASWLREYLGKRVERAEALRLLACFDRNDSRGEAQALRMFKLWLDHPNNFLADEDLRIKMAAVLDKHNT